jgi:gliding motility-associated-like protein
MNKLLPYLFFALALISDVPPAGAQCGYTAFVHTNKDYCLGSSLLIYSAHALKKIVWYKDGRPIDSALAKESLDSSLTINLQNATPDGDITSDAQGNVYLVDGAHERIIKWNPTAGLGVSTVGPYAGQSNTRLSVDRQGNVYAINATLKAISKYTPGDTIPVTVAAANVISNTDYGGGLFVDCQETIYVCDINQQSVSKWPAGASAGTVVASAGPNQPGFFGPIYVDSLGNIFSLFGAEISQWAPGATTGTTICSWDNAHGANAMWMGGDDTAYMVTLPQISEAFLTIETTGRGATSAQILGTCPSHEIGPQTGITVDPKGNIFVLDPYTSLLCEFKRHSTIDTAFMPQDTGVYYAVVTDMQGYAAMTNKIAINSPYSGTPSITITASATSTPVCTPITFTASSANFGQDPSFQWQVSGVPAGGDSTTYSYNLFANGDQIYCILQAQAGCSGPVADTSNIITLNIDAHGAASVTISTPKDSICQGDTAIFIANVTNGSNQPVYAWLINGDSTRDDSATLVRNNLANGDVITCLITSDDACGLAKSNSIPLTVSTPPTVENGQIFTILHGHSLTLDPVTTGDIDSWRWTPATGLSDTTIADPIANPDINTFYTLTVTAPGGCSASGTILVNVYTPLSISNAFTPNGDGHNDDFYVLGGPINSQVEDFAVFNRFGAEVFHAHDVAPGDKAYAWNGTFHGTPAPAGTYVYVVVMKFAGGTRQVYKGTVVLIR